MVMDGVGRLRRFLSKQREEAALRAAKHHAGCTKSLNSANFKASAKIGPRALIALHKTP